MNKSYLYAIDISGLFLSFGFIILFLAALLYISRQLKVGFSDKAIIIFFLYYYLFFIINTFTSIVPDFPDSSLFTRMVSENFYPWYQSLGVRLFYIITYPMRILSGFKIEIFILFQISIFTIALMILWKSWQIVLEHNNQDKNMGNHIFLFLAAIYPAFLLYIPIPLREFFILFGFSVMVYGIIDKYYNNKGMIYLIFGSILLLFGRPQLIVIVIIFLTLMQKNKKIKYTLIIGSLFLIPLLFTTLTSYQFKPSFFAYLRNHGADKYGLLGYGHVEWHSYFDIAMDLPGLVLQFLLSPFPILHNQNPMQFFAILLDAIYSLCIYLFVIYAGIRVSKIYVFVLLLSASIFSIWEFHIGGAPRHRMPLIAILLPIASYGIIKIYQDIKVKSNDI